MRFAVIVGLVLFSLASPATMASRIVCLDRDLSTPEQVKNRFDNAAFVFLGTVTDEVTPDFASFAFPEMPELSNFKELIAYLESDAIKKYAGKFDQQISFNVRSLWKGPPVTTLLVRNHSMPGQYGYFLERGATYLVFAFEDSDKNLQVSTVCGATLREDDAADEITALDALVKVVQPTNNALH